MESLGLSPQDSVFWVRTPPSEALKRLDRMKTGRSHEEEIASIVGRLYETSSAGAALRSMAREPKDRIKDMLNTIRGSRSPTHAELSLDDDCEDLERPDPSSPTRDLVERQKGKSAYRQGLARYSSAHELGSSTRRRGRGLRPTRLASPALSSSSPTSSSVLFSSSPSKCREDVLKMIEQINANMTGPITTSPSTATSTTTFTDLKQVPSLSRTVTPPSRRRTSSQGHLSSPSSRLRPIASDSTLRTPLRGERLRQSLSLSQQQQLRPSPGEFDSFFTELEMDEDDFEELTQMEQSSSSSSSSSSSLSSMAMMVGSGLSGNEASISYPSSSSASSSFSSSSASFLRQGSSSSSSKVISDVRRDLSDLDMKASFSNTKMLLLQQEKESRAGAGARTGAGEGDGVETEELRNVALAVEDDDDDDFSDLGDLGDDFLLEDSVFDEDIPVVQVEIDSVKYRRFKVNEVQEGVLDSRWHGPSKVLLVQDAKDNALARIFLRDSWMASRVVSGDIVHSVSAFIYSSDPVDLMVDDLQGYMIIKPDHLVPTSILAESFNCIRKPIVDMRARKTDESSIPMIHGTMLHELFQQSLKENDFFSDDNMSRRVDEIVQQHLNDLCLVQEPKDVAKEKLEELIPACQEFARKYLRAEPCLEGHMTDAMENTTGGDYALLSVNKILDIEENIWSPMFGLKGKIDASIQVKVQTFKKGGKPGTTMTNRTMTTTPTTTMTLTVPFELKTGKKSNVISHRAQTMLYTLLMTDRYDVDVQWGLLFYLKTGELIRVPAPHDQMRTILMQRNDIAAYEEQKLTLPPMAQSPQKCGWCFSFSTCTVLHKLLEDGTPETSGLGTVFEEATDHLKENHAVFLQKWNRLLSLEQGDVAKFQSQIWSMLSADRQATGNCLSYLVLVEEEEEEEEGEKKNKALEMGDSLDVPLSNNNNKKEQKVDFSLSGRFARHRYRFKMGTPPSGPGASQQTLSQTLRGGHSMLSSNISVGDPIVVSSEGQHYALAIGHVLDMTMNEVVVGLDRPLLGPPMRLDNFHEERNQTYRGLIEIDDVSDLLVPSKSNSNSSSSSSMVRKYHAGLEEKGIKFRLDKDEMTAGIARTRNNLVQLFRADKDGGDAKRRQLVVDLERPVFDPLPKDFKHPDPHLNEDQRRAVEAVMSARDYALILGMPGTGKTTTIAQIIHSLVSQGKSVLLTSYTHSAVDNVLLKLKRSEINVVRLGNKDKVHRDIQELVPDFENQPGMDTVEAIHNFYGRCQVVGTTCLGIGDPLFTEKRFDYCIVDEASQITLPACLGPIRYADVFVLVGDHNQLPPLVKNPEAKKDGFDLSLFKMLSDRYPEAVTSLTLQYRMNKDVMLLSNALVYENQLRCANEQVANKVLEIPHMDKFRQHCHPGLLQDASQQDPAVCQGHTVEHPCWLEQTLDPLRSVVFIDTDEVPAHEVQVGNSTQNPTEALLVRQLIEALISGGISEQDIGIISVLRAQLKVLSRLLRSRPLLDIHTVDRYQGKDKECVIVSLVRSNAEQHVGELLKDWRRINVAFTRAKKKLVVVGSRGTLQGSPVFERFLRLMEKQDWILKARPGAQHQHPVLLSMLSHPSGSKAGAMVMSESTARRRTSMSMRRGSMSLVALLEDAEENKENVNVDSNMVYPNRITGAQGIKIEDDNDGEEVGDDSGRRSSDRQHPKVLKVRGDVVLKKMPIVKNILDSL
ncbi:Tripartite DNA replication factor [Mortierella claussenii]|nr:Tripartite DNA replication factor [Mortierella claussenii]